MTTKPDIRPGTFLAVGNHGISWGHIPRVSNSLYCVSRVTATQAVAIGEHNREIRVRLKDLGIVGETYARAAIASEELQAQHAAQVAEMARRNVANRLTSDLFGTHLHQHKLSTAQLEALAKAWVEIKAMEA